MGLPCLNVKIESEEYLLELDTGYDSYFSLAPNLIKKIKEKSPAKFTRTADIKGNLYHAPTFNIKSLEIGKAFFKNINIKEEDSNFLLNGSVLYPPISDMLKRDYLEIHGRIGVKFFQSGEYWLIDFKNSKIVAIKDLEKYIKLHKVSQTNLAIASLEPIDSHLVILVQTDLGAKTFAIDSGASHSIIRAPSELGNEFPLCLTTDQFVIGGKDFGTIQFKLFEMSPHFKFDGLLGRDFLKKHALYLDLKNRKVLISLTSP